MFPRFGALHRESRPPTTGYRFRGYRFRGSTTAEAAACPTRYARIRGRASDGRGRCIGIVCASHPLKDVDDREDVLFDTGCKRIDHLLIAAKLRNAAGNRSPDVLTDLEPYSFSIRTISVGCGWVRYSIKLCHET